jgi:hypothetical protein
MFTFFPFLSTIRQIVGQKPENIILTVNAASFILVPRWVWGFHDGSYEQFYLLGYNAMQSDENLTFTGLHPSALVSRHSTVKFGSI